MIHIETGIDMFYIGFILGMTACALVFHWAQSNPKKEDQP